MFYRKPLLQEQVDAWNRYAFELNLHRTITMNHERIMECLKRLDSYVGAHSDANGERPEKEVQGNIAEAFWRFIAQAEPATLPPRGRPKKIRDKEDTSDETDEDDS